MVKMTSLTQEQVAILSLIECEVQKYCKKHRKAIKNNFNKTRIKLEAFCNRLNRAYKYNHFTIDECIKIKYKKH